MISLYKQDGETLYGTKEFLLDSVEDLTDIPIAKLRPGSSALIIPTGELYIFSGNKEWQVLGGKTKADKNEIVQSDWNQNDENADDYIKNRTHYHDKKYGFLFAFDTDEGNRPPSNHNGTCIMVKNSGYKFVEGETYTIITVDKYGVEISGDVVCTKNEVNSQSQLNLSTKLINSQNETTYNYNFYQNESESDTTIYGEFDTWINGNGQRSMIKLYGYIGEELKQLDEKYIPDTIARKNHDDFVITLIDNGDGTYSVDKTYLEIIHAAFLDKKNLILDNSCLSESFPVPSSLPYLGSYGGGLQFGVFVDDNATDPHNNAIPYLVGLVITPSDIVVYQKSLFNSDINLLSTNNKTIIGAINEVNSTKANVLDVETKTDAQTKLDEAKAYADSVSSSAATTVKNGLLNGAGGAYDTLKELGDLIDENTTVIDALETVATGKADKVHSHEIADVNGLQTTLDEISEKANENEVFVANLTYDVGWDEFSCDKSFEEIEKAYNDNKVVLLKNEEYCYYCHGSVNGSNISFVRYVCDDDVLNLIYIIINNENIIRQFSEEVLTTHNFVSTLDTTNKTIVRAINELHSELDEKKDKDFVVTITGNDTDGYTTDKTFEEIVESHKSGKILTCISSEGVICDLTVIDEGYGAIFVNYVMNLHNGALLSSYTVFILSDSSVREEKVRFDTGNTDLLATTDKTIVGAINEVNAKANESDEFVVNVTYSYPDYTADKTFSDIQNAYKQNKNVIARAWHKLYSLGGISDHTISFTNFTPLSGEDGGYGIYCEELQFNEDGEIRHFSYYVWDRQSEINELFTKIESLESEIAALKGSTE